MAFPSRYRTQAPCRSSSPIAGLAAFFLENMSCPLYSRGLGRYLADGHRRPARAVPRCQEPWYGADWRTSGGILQVHLGRTPGFAVTMRILIITNLYPPVIIGGYELACSNVAQGMRERGHEVRVLTTWCHLPQRTATPPWVHRCLDLHIWIPHRSENVTVYDRDLHSAICSSYANTMKLLNSIREFRLRHSLCLESDRDWGSCHDGPS